MTCEDEDENTTWSCWLRTTMAASGALVAICIVGINEAQSAVMLPQLRKADSGIHPTPKEETWIASAGIIMTPVSAILTGPFIDMFGRKRGLQCFYFSMGFGFSVVGCARDVYQIYVGRVVCGIGIGFQMTAVVYIAETCTTKSRSRLLASVGTITSVGVVMSTIIGGYLTWSTASLMYAAPCFFFFLLEFFIPESPPWLFKMGKEDACVQSLYRLGKNHSLVRQELNTLKLSMKHEAEKVDFRTFLKPTVWKPFVIMSTLFLLQSGSGVYILIYYTVDFVERLGTKYNPVTISIILSVARLLSTATIGVYLRARRTRRSTLIFSAAGMSTTLFCVGIYEFIYRNTVVSSRPLQWVPILFLILYMATGMSGMFGLPWGMTGEVYPLRVRGTMTSLSYFVGFSIMFISVKEYKTCLELLQIYGLLFAFAILSWLALLFGIFILPETSNKSLLEIEQSFLPKTVAKECTLPDGTKLKVATTPKTGTG